MESAILTLAARLAQLSSTLSPKPLKGGLADWQLRRTIAALGSGETHAHSIEELAQNVGLSPFHFVRAFKRSTGLPPHQYQMRERIERARSRLTDSNDSIRKIAADLGFRDPRYFARLFAREVGATPARFRRERRA